MDSHCTDSVHIVGNIYTFWPFLLCPFITAVWIHREEGCHRYSYIVQTYRQLTVDICATYTDCTCILAQRGGKTKRWGTNCACHGRKHLHTLSTHWTVKIKILRRNYRMEKRRKLTKPLFPHKQCYFSLPSHRLSMLAINATSLSLTPLSMLATLSLPYQCWPPMLPLTPLSMLATNATSHSLINVGHPVLPLTPLSMLATQRYVSLLSHRLSMLDTNATQTVQVPLTPLPSAGYQCYLSLPSHKKCHYYPVPEVVG